MINVFLYGTIQILFLTKIILNHILPTLISQDSSIMINRKIKRKKINFKLLFFYY